MKKVFIFVMACCVTSFAFADEAKKEGRKINFSEKILDLNGIPYPECDRWKETKPGEPMECLHKIDLTLGIMCAAAVKHPEQGLLLDKIVHRGTLAALLQKGGEIELVAEDITLIKEQIAKLNIDAVEITAAVRLLDPAAVK